MNGQRQNKLQARVIKKLPETTDHKCNYTKNDFDVNKGTEGPAGDLTMKFFLAT